MGLIIVDVEVNYTSVPLVRRWRRVDGGYDVHLGILGANGVVQCPEAVRFVCRSTAIEIVLISDLDPLNSEGLRESERGT